MANKPLTKLSVNYTEIHELSVDLLELLQEHDVPIGTAMMTLILTFGRLASEDVLEPEQEGQFIQAVLDFTGMYFAKGEPN